MDDKAELIIKEVVDPTAPVSVDLIDETLSVNGTALWNLGRSYKEFPQIFPGGRKYDLDLTYQNTANLTEQYDGLIDHDGINVFIVAVPMELAPEVLPVNSDFDEGRIDPATGYAIPDCDDIPGVDRKTGAGNVAIKLETVRKHLEGAYENNELVTAEMHQGWFGVHPKYLKDEFWQGATVTIRKIDKIDGDTGRAESGQVRFYSKWDDPKFGSYVGIVPYDFDTLQPVNLVSAGINGKPGEAVYGASSNIPDEAEFWMEGVRPGKITLEWRLQKGDVDIRHEQTFLVATDWPKVRWQDLVRYQLKLQSFVRLGSEIDIADYDPDNGFNDISAPGTNNVPAIVEIYYYYRQLFRRYPEELMWAGLAKVAAAPIYAGMADLDLWLDITPAWSPVIGETDFGIEVFIEELLLEGQKAIFNDKAWAHCAYIGSGISALEFIAKNEPEEVLMPAWRKLDVGMANQDASVLTQAAGDLLLREQRDVIQPNYNVIQNLPIEQPARLPFSNAIKAPETPQGYANAGEWLSLNSNKNPMPGGPGFRATVPNGRLDNFAHRWIWTFTHQDSMFAIWSGKPTATPSFNAARRAELNNLRMMEAAEPFSYAKDLPAEPEQNR